MSPEAVRVKKSEIQPQAGGRVWNQKELRFRYLGFRGSRFRVFKTANRRISNIEPQNVEVINDRLFNKDRAKRFHPSTFYIRNSAVLLFAFKLILNSEPLNPEPLNL
jgi:hypothetical protein